MPPITCNMAACKFNKGGECKAPAVVLEYEDYEGFSCEAESWRKGVYNWREEENAKTLRQTQYPESLSASGPLHGVPVGDC